MHGYDEKRKIEMCENTYKSQLIYAQQYIDKLEKHLSEQKVEMKRCKDSMRRKRRPGMHNTSIGSKFQYFESLDLSKDDILEENVEISLNQLVLKIESVESGLEDNSTSFYFNSLCGKTYLVGKEGTTIGSGQGCGIRLPSETGISVYHAAIKYDSDKNKFYILSYPQKKTSYIQDLKQKEKELEKESINVGFTFSTGIFHWKVYSLSPTYAMVTSLYSATKSNDVDSFNAALDMYTSLISHTHSADNICIVDNMQYYRAVNDNFEKKCQHRHGISLLQYAVKHGSFDIAQRLLEEGANIDLQYGEQKLTALHVAVMNNDYEMTKFILQNGADLEICDVNSRSPISMSVSHKIRKLLLDCVMLCSACYGGDNKEVERILNDTDATVGVKGFRGHTPLTLACKSGDFAIVKALLAQNPYLNIQCGYMKRTCLHMAVLRDDVDLAHLLISHGADTQVLDRCGYSPEIFVKSLPMRDLFTKDDLTLCSAVQCNDVITVEKLLDYTKEHVSYTIPPEELCRKISMKQLGRKASLQLLQQNAGMTPLINQKNGRGLAPIHLAAASGNVDLIYLLASYGANMKIPGGVERWTPLFFAALCHKKDAVKALLMLGAEKEYCFAHGMTCKDHLDHVIKVANQLKESMNFDENIKSFEYITAMIPPQFIQETTYNITCENDVDSLIDSCYEILQVLCSSQEKMLNVLKDADAEGLMRLLDQEEVDVNELLNKTLPITPLDYAASTGMIDLVDILLLYNADPTIDDPKGFTPLHTAVESGHLNVVESFLKFNVNVNIVTRYERYTPLHIAVMHSHKKIIEILIDHGVDTSLKDINNCKAFDLTNDEIIQRMLASPEDHFFLAVSQNDLSLVEILLETSPNINQHFPNGLTPLHLAAKLGHIEMATFLINNGADVNIQDCNNVSIGTPLHYACSGNSIEMTQLLLDNGASLSLENGFGKTPYEVSSTNKIRWILVSKFQRPSIDVEKNKEEISDARDDAGDDALCSICCDNKIDVIVLPCLHQAFCAACISQERDCPFCRVPISGVNLLNEEPQ